MNYLGKNTSVRGISQLLALLILLGIYGGFPASIAYAQEDRVVAHCKPPPDPTDFDAVYRCFSSGIGITSQTSECIRLTGRYRKLLERANAIRRREADQYIPGCDILARVVHEMLGEESYWKDCLDYGSIPAEDHLQRCLTRFMPGYTKVGLKRLKTCADVRRYYETALRSAHISKKLSSGYQAPSCEIAAAFLTKVWGRTPQWASCFDYAPDKLVEHLPVCLGNQFARLKSKDCKDIKAAYKGALETAYGALPPNYIQPRCSEIDAALKTIAQAENAKKRAIAAEEERQKKVREQKLREEREKRKADSASSDTYWLLFFLFIFVVVGMVALYVYKKSAADSTAGNKKEEQKAKPKPEVEFVMTSSRFPWLGDEDYYGREYEYEIIGRGVLANKLFALGFPVFLATGFILGGLFYRFGGSFGDGFFVALFVSGLVFVFAFVVLRSKYAKVTLIVTPERFFIQEQDTETDAPERKGYQRALMKLPEVAKHHLFTDEGDSDYEGYHQVMFRYGEHGEERVFIPGASSQTGAQDRHALFQKFLADADAYFAEGRKDEPRKPVPSAGRPGGLPKRGRPGGL